MFMMQESLILSAACLSKDSTWSQNTNVSMRGLIYGISVVTSHFSSSALKHDMLEEISSDLIGSILIVRISSNKMSLLALRATSLRFGSNAFSNSFWPNP